MRFLLIASVMFASMANAEMSNNELIHRLMKKRCALIVTLHSDGVMIKSQRTTEALRFSMDLFFLEYWYLYRKKKPPQIDKEFERDVVSLFRFYEIDKEPELFLFKFRKNVKNYRPSEQHSFNSLIVSKDLFTSDEKYERARKECFTYFLGEANGKAKGGGP